MTKQEALNKIEELKKYVEDLSNKVGFENDTLFLLSIEEYEKYKYNIPPINTWWWLRSPGHFSDYATNILSCGSVNELGNSVNIENGAVRPAVKCYDKYPIGKRKILHNFPFIKIGEDLYIAEVPIAFHNFNNIMSNNYEISDIRQFLSNWKNNR